MSNKIRKDKTFKSIIEFEKEFFPKSYQRKIEEKMQSEPKIYGTGIAIEILDNIKQQLLSEH